MLSSTADKCLQVLDVIAKSVSETKSGIQTRAIADKLGFNITSTYRYIATLEKHNMIHRGVNDMWLLGSKVVELYYTFTEQSNLYRIASDFMLELWQKTQETVYLGSLIDEDVFYLNKMDSPLPIRPNANIGHRNKLYCTGLGKAILAYSDQGLVDRVAEVLVPRTSTTITNKEDLIREMQSIRSRGFSIDLSENEEEVRCVGAPIFDSSNSVIAALSISGPVSRMSEERLSSELGPLVREACSQISVSLGYLK